MQAELSAPGNAGDVLASIRRMIALEGGDSCALPGDTPLILSQSQQVAPVGTEAEPSVEEANLSAEEEAEFAEAEAALARMLAPARAAEPEAPDAADEGDMAGMNLFFASGDTAQMELRTLVRTALRHELEGEMGANFSRNLQSLIRQEVEAAIRGLSASR